MTSKCVRYSLQDHVATICIDDGKRNALSPQILRATADTRIFSVNQIMAEPN